MISVAEICNDPDLAQHVTIYRSQGQFGPGGWVNQTTQIPAYGSLQPATAKSLQMIPEGDRVEGAIQFFTTQPIYSTSEDQSRISDQIMWQENMYRVSGIFKWNEFGYYGAILVRMTGS